MALSLVGWINGLSVTGIVIFTCAFGLFIIYESKKNNIKLLFYGGLMINFMGLVYLGNLIDFLTILLTGKNMDNSYGLLGILCSMWWPPCLFCVLYIGAELLVPEKLILKKIILFSYLVLGIIIEIFIFLDPMGTIEFIYPTNSGEDLIEDHPNLESPIGILTIILFISVTIFCGFGFLYKGIQSTGVIRKKSLLLSLGYISVVIMGTLESFVPPGIFLVLVRIGIACSYFLFYLGLKEELEKNDKVKPKKEVKVKGDLFRISKYKREDITEEEVSISKEKKICLVCKNKATGFNIYACPSCDTLYCQKCALALTNLENACWACGNPIDESKPVKPFKKDEEEIEEIEISEKSQKKPKNQGG